ncbi:MAG: hypothetical protein H6700_11745, partial [Myxococcales bacterium]|nr:hypothetical protein [Myxococcales bacterium]
MERRHLVIAACALMLASACNLLIDSDDALVERDADAATADGSGRDAADAEVDVAPDGNPCGGSAALVYRGVMRMPGDRCGCTGTLVCAGPDALLCANDVGNNACGGCGALPGVPSGACGACGGGTWECDGGELTCVGALQLNLCGGCALLEGPPGAACDGPEGSRWECSAGDRVICELPSRNLCGAFGDLTYEGLDATPGEACEADCGAGRLICDPDARALFCDGPEANGCGSCGPLAGPLGEGCGCGGGGTWTCNDGEAECVGGDSNACGGCAPLAVAPGQRCPDGGLRICASRDATACATFGEGTNFCGGIIELDDLPGTACGTCDSGTFACQGPNEVACEGDRAGAALNACGGCEPLIGVAGGGCGTCGRGTLRCSGTDEFVCTGDPGASALNACGGCAGLDGVPGTACGTCAAWRCIGGGVQCLKDPGGTNCGGSRVTCEELECGAENRGCTEATLTADAECGACLDGYEERAGTCEPVAGDTLPEVTTVSVDPATITQTSVRLRGALTSLGSPNASQHGFCRGSGRDPALGGDGVACSTLGPPTTTGPFEEVVSALAPASTFHARAYAT